MENEKVIFGISYEIKQWLIVSKKIKSGNDFFWKTNILKNNKVVNSYVEKNCPDKIVDSLKKELSNYRLNN